MNDIDLKMYDEIMGSKIFSDEEKEFFKIRFEKEKRRKVIYDKLDNIDFSSDEFKSLLQDLIKIDGDRCEHDRSLMGTCSACDEMDEKSANIYASLLSKN